MSILTLEERKLVAVQELIPHKDSGTPVALDTFDRIARLVSSAKKVFDAKTDLVQHDLTNADICKQVLQDTGCNEEECQGKDVTQRYWEGPQHIFQHLISVCIAYHDKDINKGHAEDGACKWCTGGVMDNYQRGTYTRALNEWRDAQALKKKEEEEKEAQDTPPIF